LNIYLSHYLVAQGLSHGLRLRPLSLCLGLERVSLESKAVIIMITVVIILLIVVLLMCDCSDLLATSDCS